MLEYDYAWGGARDVRDVPAVLIERLQHYFSTYKIVPERPNAVVIHQVYGRLHAQAVVEAAMRDYDNSYGDLDAR